MKKIWLVGVAAASLLAMAGCGKGNGQEGKAQDPAKQTETPKKAQASNVIHLTADSQRLAGMQVVEVQSRAVPDTLTVAGQITANEQRTAHIGVYSSGRVTEVTANLGDTVKAGQVLARMHSHDVHETLAAYQIAKQDVQHQQSAVEYSQRMRDRMQRLFGQQYASTQEVEKAEADLRSAQTNLANAHIAVERETAHLSDILHLPPDKLDQIDEATEQVPVVAPIGGVVTARMITPGAVVEPGQEVFTVADLRTVWMMASVNETDIAKVRIGSPAKVKTQAYPDQEFAGTVSVVGAELDAKTRTLPVRLLLRNPGEKLRVSMYANAELTRGMTRSAIFVPEEALQEINGGSVVFVRRDAEDFEARPVEIGDRANGQARIQAGLHAGDAVVVKSSFVAKSELLKSQIGE